MFNTSYSGGPRSVNVRATTHEHRAPTDDSVRLLNEMRQKLIDQIVSSGRAPFANEISWHVLDRPETFGVEIVGLFKLNGREHRFAIHLRSARLRSEAEPNTVVDEIYESLTKQVAGALTEDLLRGHMGEIIQAISKK